MEGKIVTKIIPLSAVGQTQQQIAEYNASGTWPEILSKSAKKSAMRNCIGRLAAPNPKIKKTALAEAVQAGVVEEIRSLLGGR